MDEIGERAVRHLRRFEVLACQGRESRALARLYVVTLAHQADVRERSLATSPHANPVHRAAGMVRAAAKRAAYVEAHAVGGFGLLAWDAEHPLLRVLEIVEAMVEPARVELVNGMPSVSHAVRSAYWPELGGFGLSVRAEDRTDQRRGIYVEADVHVPDQERTQLRLRRRVETREAAVALAGRWAALGFAVLGAEDVLQSREGVSLPAPATPEARAS